MAAGRSSGRYAAAKLTFSPLLRVVVPLPPSSLPSPSQQTHNPSDLGSSHPYINHSLIPLATHYIGSIDFSLLQQRWRGNPPQWSHTQEVGKQATGVFRWTAMADSPAFVTTKQRGNQCTSYMTEGKNSLS